MAQILVGLQLGPPGVAQLEARTPALFPLFECARQQAAAQRAIAENAYSVRPASRDHLEFDGPLAKVVHTLFRHEPQHVPSSGLLVGLDDVPRRKVAAAHVGDLAAPYQLSHHLPDLVPRGAGAQVRCVPERDVAAEHTPLVYCDLPAVDMVHLVQVNVIGLQALQARLRSAANVISTEATVVNARPHHTVHFGCEDDAISPIALGKPSANDLLRLAAALRLPIAIGSVKEVDAQFQRALHNRVALRLRSARTEVHRPQTEATDAQPSAAQFCVLHVHTSDLSTELQSIASIIESRSRTCKETRVSSPPAVGVAARSPVQ